MSFEERICPTCLGAGRIRDEGNKGDPGPTTMRKCLDCNGTGAA